MRDDGEGIGFGCGFLAVGMPYSLPSRKAASIRVHSRTSPERGARNFTPINTMSKPHCGHFRTKRGGTTPRWSRTKYSCALLNTFRQLKQACWLRAGIAQRGLTVLLSQTQFVLTPEALALGFLMLCCKLMIYGFLASP
jgi:hypothetical protein